MPFLALLAAPFTIKFGALNVYNTLMLVAPGLSAWGIYLAGFELTADFGAAAAAGATFFLSSYMTSQMQGHLNLSFVIAVPLCIWATIAAAKRGWGKWHYGSFLGLLLAFEFGVSQEVYATIWIFGPIAASLLFIMDTPQRPVLIRLAPGIAIGLALSLVICAPLIFEMLRWYGNDTAGIAAPVYMSNDVAGIFLPTRIDWIGGHFFASESKQFPGNLSEQSAYLGLPMVLLLIGIFIKGKTNPLIPFLCAIILLASILSFGPYVHIVGQIISTAPWIIAAKLPFLRNMYPDRFMMYAQLGIAILCSVWLAGDGPKLGRYFLLGSALIFLIPDQVTDRHWTNLDIPPVFTNDTVPASARILILPQYGDETAFQYASAMRFSMVGQGYLITGDPDPFAQWPIFKSLKDNRFEDIDAKIFAAYLAYYGVERVVVTKAGYIDYWHNRALNGTEAAEAAAKLLAASGWQVAGADNDAVWFRPAVSQIPPNAALVAEFMATPFVEMRMIHREKAVRMEQRWVCTIRKIAKFLPISSQTLLDIYTRHAHPPLAVTLVNCSRS